ncbi:MAG: hypothetical protein ACE5K4_07210 [Candidatus Hydrothermarchaeota archaeon]
MQTLNMMSTVLIILFSFLCIAIVFNDLIEINTDTDDIEKLHSLVVIFNEPVLSIENAEYSFLDLVSVCYPSRVDLIEEKAKELKSKVPYEFTLILLDGDKEIFRIGKNKETSSIFFREKIKSTSNELELILVV